MRTGLDRGRHRRALRRKQIKKTFNEKVVNEHKWDSSVSGTGGTFDKTMKKVSIFTFGKGRQASEELEKRERSRKKKKETLKTQRKRKKTKKKRDVRALNRSEKFRRRLHYLKRRPRRRATAVRVERDVQIERGDEEEKEEEEEDADRKKKRREMELRLARQIQKTILSCGRKGTRSSTESVTSLPVTRMFRRVARGVVPHKTEIPQAHFERLLQKPCYGGLSRAMTRWLALFLGSDGMFVPMKHFIDFLKHRRIERNDEDTSSAFPSNSIVMMRQASIREDDSYENDSNSIDELHLERWEITVLMAIRDAVRANRRVFSKELHPQVSGKRESWVDTLGHAFRAFDLDDNGEISSSEFRSVLERLDIRLSKAQYDQFLRSIDCDGDGKIQYTEFLRTMRKKVKRMPTLRAEQRPPPRRRGTWWGTYEAPVVENDDDTHRRHGERSRFSSEEEDTVDNDDEGAASRYHSHPTRTSKANSTTQSTTDEALERLERTFEDCVDVIKRGVSNVLQEEEAFVKSLVVRQQLKDRAREMRVSRDEDTTQKIRRGENGMSHEQRERERVLRDKLLRHAEAPKTQFLHTFDAALTSDHHTTADVLGAMTAIESYVLDCTLREVSAELLSVVDETSENIAQEM